MAILKALSVEEAKQVAARAECQSSAAKSACQLAIDYLEGRQIQDVEAQLQTRFPATQQGEAGQRIEPVALPLVERYAAEAANAYNKPVTRTLKLEDGSENDATREATAKYNRMLEAAGYDEVMHRNEQLTVLLRGSAILYEAKRGKLRASIKLPHDIAPCLPGKPQLFDPADADDYDAYILELHGAVGIGKKEYEKTYALITNAEISFWTGEAPTKLRKRQSSYENPYSWEQTYDDIADDGRRITKTAKVPGRMLTFWHERLPLDRLLPNTVPEIVAVNRELNIAWASLLDVIKLQGFAVPVLNLQNKADVKAKRRYGARFPLILKINESFQLASAATSFSEQVQVLKDMSRMLAGFKRQSPNDFAFDGSGPVSGFAKLIDQLPKMELRQERIRRLTAMEEEEAYPRCREIGITLGLLEESTRLMNLHVKFADVEYPRTEDERAKKYETDTKYNLTTQAKLYAERYGVSEAEAEEAIRANAEKNAASAPPQPPGFGGGMPMQQGQPSGVLGTLVGRTNRQQGPKAA